MSEWIWLEGTAMEDLPAFSSVLIKASFRASCVCSSQIKTKSLCFNQPLLWGHLGNADAIGHAVSVRDSDLDFDQCGCELVQGKQMLNGLWKS